MSKIKVPKPATQKDLVLLENKLNKKFDQVFKELEKHQKLFRFEIMSNTISARQKLEEQLFKFRDEMFVKIDPILREVEDAKIDRDLSTEQAENFKSRIKELEAKIKKLENTIKQN